MDQVLADTLTANLKHAVTQEAKIDAMVLATIAVVDCQLKTSTRVKAISEARAADENRRVGAKWMLGVVVTLASVVGPTGAIVICKWLKVLW